MTPLSLPFFSLVLKDYVRQLGTTPDLLADLLARPNAPEAVIRPYVKALRRRLTRFYETLPHLDRPSLTVAQHETLTWFTENRMFLGGNVRTLCGERRGFHEHLDGAQVTLLIQALDKLQQDSLGTFSEETLVGALVTFTTAHPLSTDEAQSVPFLNRLLLLGQVLGEAEAFLRDVLSTRPQNVRTGTQRFLERLKNSDSGRLPPPPPSPFPVAEGFRERMPRKNAAGTGSAVPLSHIGAVIKALRIFDEIDWEAVTSGASEADQLLALDPAGVYVQMTPATRIAYRERLRFLSRTSGIAERELAERALAHAASSRLPHERHVGYWLLDAGHKELLTGFPEARTRFPYGLTDALAASYFPCLFVLTVVFATLLAWAFPWPSSVFIFLFALFPALRTSKQLLNELVGTAVPAAFLPKLEVKAGLPKEMATAFVIPAFLTPASLAGLLYKLEVAYLGNRGAHVRFGLLLDAPDAQAPQTPADANLRETAKAAITALNTRYGETDAFFLFLRSSPFNPPEGVFMGWERKRGKLLELMRVLRGQATTSACELFPALAERVEFLVTVDEDAHVPHGFVRELLAIHAHPLRKPTLEALIAGNRHGSTFLQPRMRPWFTERTKFLPKIFGEGPSQGSYASQAADLYQDLFDQGNFGGKGSIHIDGFLATLDTFFPENQVLSHDLLEGNLSGTTYVSTVTLYDAFPTSLNGYLMRMHRWIRGDWQTAPWLFGWAKRVDGTWQRNPLNALGRFKILDNLVESLTGLALLGILLIAGAAGTPSAFVAGGLAAIFAGAGAISYLFQSLYLLRALFTSEDADPFGRIQGFLEELWRSLRRTLVEFAFFPYTVGTALDAILRALYRQLVTHRRLLEWNTAANAEQASAWQRRYALVPGLLLTLVSGMVLFTNGSNLVLVGGLVLFFVGVPFLLSLLTQQRSWHAPGGTQETFLRDTARRTWAYYADIVTNGTAFLPPDHLQVFPSQKTTPYTSISNIGFYLLSILAAVKLGLIASAEAQRRLDETVTTLEGLPRHGRLFYNWYSVQTGEPEADRLISSVDLGNLLACLITVSSWLSQEARPTRTTDGRNLWTRVEELIHTLDFQALASEKKHLLAVSLDPATGTLSPSFYQTLASESRLSVLLAIAKDNLPVRAWGLLSRVTKRQPHGGSTVLSWSGTLFEYLMPTLFLSEPRDSLMGTGMRHAYANHRAHLADLGLCGALSESGYAAFNASGDYGYKAFGIPSLALSPHADGRPVIAPYAVALGLAIDQKAALRDLEHLATKAYGRYGFLEALDHTTEPDGQPIGTYMSHHQGMLLGALTNALHTGFLQTLFTAHPLVQTVLFLIDEPPGRPTKELFPET